MASDVVTTLLLNLVKRPEDAARRQAGDVERGLDWMLPLCLADPGGGDVEVSCDLPIDVGTVTADTSGVVTDTGTRCPRTDLSGIEGHRIPRSPADTNLLLSMSVALGGSVRVKSGVGAWKDSARTLGGVEGARADSDCCVNTVCPRNVGRDNCLSTVDSGKLPIDGRRVGTRLPATCIAGPSELQFAEWQTILCGGGATKLGGIAGVNLPDPDIEITSRVDEDPIPVSVT